MKCPKCSYENKEGLSYCARCGNFIGNTCPNCKEAVEPGNVYCGSCGWKLNPDGKSQDLTEEFATFLRGTKQTLQYWGWAFLGILLVIGILLGVGEWGVLTKKAQNQARKAVDECIKNTIDTIEDSLINKASRLESDKGYLNLRIARLLKSIHKEFVTGEEYKRNDYINDIDYWIDKAKQQYGVAINKDYRNVQAYFELGRLHYYYPIVYYPEEKRQERIDRKEAEKNFVKA